MLGDMNINLKNDDTETNNYKETLNANGFLVLDSLEENYYTRKCNTIKTDKIHNEYNIALVNTSLSDQYAD